MKSVVAVLSLVAAASAQDIAALAQCGQTCANNMMAANKAEELGCNEGDLKCLCTNVNFTYGLRDCSRAICSEEDANQVVQYGMRVCEGAGVVVTGGNGGNGGASATTIYSVSTGSDGSVVSTAVATSTIGGAQVTTILSGTTESDGKVVSVPVATSTISGSGNGVPEAVILSTYTTDGSQVVTTLTTELRTSDFSQSSGTESGSATSGASESNSSGSSTSGASETSSGASETSSGAASSTGASGAESTSAQASATSTSKGPAAQITAAPGLLAAIGLAALLI